MCNKNTGQIFEEIELSHIYMTLSEKENNVVDCIKTEKNNKKKNKLQYTNGLIIKTKILNCYCLPIQLKLCLIV